MDVHCCDKYANMESNWHNTKPNQAEFSSFFMYTAAENVYNNNEKAIVYIFFKKSVTLRNITERYEFESPVRYIDYEASFQTMSVKTAFREVTDLFDVQMGDKSTVQVKRRRSVKLFLNFKPKTNRSSPKNVLFAFSLHFSLASVVMLTDKKI